MTNIQRIRPALLAVAALLGCGDSSERVDLGDDQVEVSGATLTDYTGRWSGYAEGYQFEEETDRLTITIAVDGSGTLTVGEGAPLPPPNPLIGYPRTVPVGGPAPIFGRGLVAGFRYTFNGAVVDDSRLRLRVSEGELHEEWCALQTPVLDEYNSTAQEQQYMCLPNTGFGSSDQGCHVGIMNPTPVDCGQLECLELCGCDASGCFVRYAEPNVSLDATLEAQGTKLVGTLVLRDQRVTVRMTRSN